MEMQVESGDEEDDHENYDNCVNDGDEEVEKDNDGDVGGDADDHHLRHHK